MFGEMGSLSELFLPSAAVDTCNWSGLVDHNRFFETSERETTGLAVSLK